MQGVSTHRTWRFYTWLQHYVRHCLILHRGARDLLNLLADRRIICAFDITSHNNPDRRVIFVRAGAKYVVDDAFAFECELHLCCDRCVCASDSHTLLLFTESWAEPDVQHRGPYSTLIRANALRACLKRVVWRAFDLQGFYFLSGLGHRCG